MGLMGYWSHGKCYSTELQSRRQAASNRNVTKAERSRKGILQPLSSPDCQSPAEPNLESAREKPGRDNLWCEPPVHRAERKAESELGVEGKLKIISTVVKGIAPHSSI